MNKPREVKMAKILEVREENARMRTLILGADMSAYPGQFAMLWLPSVNEKPFSFAYCEEGKIGFTVAKVGAFSEKLCQLKPGDSVGIRGPFGNGFKPKGNKIAIVGGGCGTAPLGFLMEKLAKSGKKVFFIIGARTKSELLFAERARSAGAETIICTDDGSEGRKGFTTDALAELLEKEQIDAVCTCGPEIMMKKVLAICEGKGVECLASLERWMKCGFGVCGQCAIDGFLVCKEGPVFNSAKLRRMKEFGSLKRDACGAQLKA